MKYTRLLNFFVNLPNNNTTRFNNKVILIVYFELSFFSQFASLGVVKQLQSLLSKGPRPRYHASRALVYMGHLDLLQGFDLFDPVATGYETDIVINSTDSDGHIYARYYLGMNHDSIVDLSSD